MSESTLAALGMITPTYACLDCGHCTDGITLTWQDGEDSKSLCLECRGHRVEGIVLAIETLVAEVKRLRGVDCGVTELDRTITPLCGVCVECAHKRGAEAMREAAAAVFDCKNDPFDCDCTDQDVADKIRTLPVPEDES